MKKHTSEEAYYERLRKLSKVNETSKQSQSRNIGTLIDYKRAADGVAYGIIKEQHHYYVKKAGLKQDPNAADFAYIGGMQNITDFQYKSLSEAEKQRNMLFCTINEAVTTKVSKTGSKKKGKLNEDKAGEEIDASAEMAAGLDAATDVAQEMPTEPAMDLGGAETPVPEPAPEAGLEGGEEAIPAPEGGEEPAPEAGLEGGEEAAPEGSEEEVPAPEGDEEAAPAPEGGEEKDMTTKEIEKSLGKLTNKLRQTELTDSQVKSYVNSFLAAFKDKFPDVEIEDRKAMAEKITKVVPDEEIEDLGQNVEATEDNPVPAEEPAGVEEGQCSECGGFAQYAESRGYNAQSIMECGEEEMSNLVSGYANAHNDGQNDGDFKAVALFITPEIIEKLRGDYGHDEYADKLTPYTNELSECSVEDKQAQINELFGSFGAGMKNVFNKGAEKVGGAIQKGAEKVSGAAKDVYQAGKEKVGQVKQGVQNVAGQVKTAYHTGALSNEMKKANELGNQFANQVIALQQRAEKAGQTLDTNKLLTGISNQLRSGKPVNVAGTTAGGALRTSEGLDDPTKVEVQPLEEIEVPQAKAGQKLSASAPVKQIKEDEEPEGEEIEAGEVDIENGAGEEKAEIGFAPASQSLGAGVIKPEGAGVQIEITPDKNVSIQMSESEKKLRKYIRERLEVKAGLKKASLNENKKSEKLKKLDEVIDKQFQLFESVMIKEGLGDFVGKMANKVNQSMEGKYKKQRELKAAIEADPQMAKSALANAYSAEIMFNAGLKNFISAATPENAIQVAQQAANDPDGLGKLTSQRGVLVYIPAGKVK